MAGISSQQYSQLVPLAPVPEDRTVCVRVMVVGSYGGYNLGDDLILRRIVSDLKSAGHTVVATSGTPAHTSERLGIECVPLIYPRRASFSALRVVGRCDALVIGGGNQVMESRSGVPLWGLLTSASLAVRAAHRAGVPSMLWAVGVDPRRTAFGPWLVRRWLRHARVATVRDPESAARLTAYGFPESRIRIAADPAFAVPRASHADSRGFLDELIPGLPEGGPRILLTPGADPRYDAAYLPEMIHGVREAAEAENGVVLLHLMDRQRGIDRSLLQRRDLAESATLRHVPLLDYSETDLARLHAGASVVISSRMHALILAATQGTPWTGPAVAPKIAALARRFGQSLPANGSDFASRLSERVRALSRTTREEWQAQVDPLLADAVSSSRDSLRTFEAVIASG